MRFQLAGFCDAAGFGNVQFQFAQKFLRLAVERREGIAESMYYNWSKDFLEAGKRRLAGDTTRAATSDEVKALRQEARTLKEVVAEQALELRLLKKSMTADGGDPA